MKSRFLALISLLFTTAVNSSIAQRQDTRLVQQTIKSLTDVMVFDITSPPVASRNYAYSIIAFYEAARPGNIAYKSFSGILNGLDSLPSVANNDRYDWLIAGSAAFYKTAYAFVFSKDLFKKSFDSVIYQIRKYPVSPEIYERSVKYGEQVAERILSWARKDNYAKIRSMHRFTAGRVIGTWQQTPPDYIEAIEPNWDKLRPLTLVTSQQFEIPAPPAYKTDAFIEECKLVYETNKRLTKEQKNTADFWDCNPFATETVGHLTYSIKKMSPGGHWIEITGIAVRQKKQSLTEALHTYCLVSIGIYDAFIATWNIKYKTNYIRPVTAIQQLISPTWQPLLQTPPFPEYPSGHSVISMTSAVVLTRIFGDNFKYTDNCEKEFGVPDRTFTSFYQAANEAAISRLYGGIHFLPAVENGKDLGRKVGNFILEKANFTKIKKF
jgi:hypothetical protein